MSVTFRIVLNTANLDKLNAQFNSTLADIGKVLGQKCESYAKDYCPVDTGALRSSIHAEFPKNVLAEVIADTNYAMYVEMGTYKMAAQPYLQPAVVKIAPEVMSLATWERLWS
jgi:HK97 gp10 family phage protein